MVNDVIVALTLKYEVGLKECKELCPCRSARMVCEKDVIGYPLFVSINR